MRELEIHSAGSRGLALIQPLYRPELHRAFEAAGYRLSGRIAGAIQGEEIE